MNATEAMIERSELRLQIAAESRSMNERHDCVVRALSVAFEVEYREVWEMLLAAGRKPRHGTNRSIWMPVADVLNVRRNDELLTWLPQPHWGRTVTTFERRLSPKWNALVLTRGHLLAVSKGGAIDHTRGRRHRVIQYALVRNPNC